MPALRSFATIVWRGLHAVAPNTVTSTGPAGAVSPSLPSAVSAACSRDTPMEKPVAGTGCPMKRDTSPS